MSDNLKFVAQDSKTTIAPTTPNDVESDTVASEPPDELALA